MKHELSSRQNEISERIREIKSRGHFVNNSESQATMDDSVVVIVLDGYDVPMKMSVKTLGEHKKSIGKMGTAGLFVTEDHIEQLKRYVVEFGKSVLVHGLFVTDISIVHTLSTDT